MLIEAISCPVRYQWPSGEIRLEPGKPICVDRQRGEKILQKCQNMVRIIQPNWESAWRDLAELSEGITKNDPRFQPVCEALEECDRHFENDDWPKFQESTAMIKRILGF